MEYICVAFSFRVFRLCNNRNCKKPPAMSAQFLVVAHATFRLTDALCSKAEKGHLFDACEQRVFVLKIAQPSSAALRLAARDCVV